jgi:hypothetical protein
MGVAARCMPTMVTLYGGALFTLVTSPPQHITPELARGIATGSVDAAKIWSSPTAAPAISRRSRSGPTRTGGSKR